MLSVYIAGPMSGYPEHNFPAFHAAAEQWQKAGWNVINPAELDGEDTEEAWRYYLRRDIQLLVDCDAIALLPGWQESKGATLEAHIAKELGIPQYDADHVAQYVNHKFVAGYNACCLKPDYNHEEFWPTR